MKQKQKKCKRCLYTWYAKVEKPVRCASCRSILWNKDYIYNVKKKI